MDIRAQVAIAKAALIALAVMAIIASGVSRIAREIAEEIRKQE